MKVQITCYFSCFTMTRYPLKKCFLSVFSHGMQQNAIVPGKNGCSTGWAGVLTKSYCKMLAQYGGRGNILMIHVCCGPQTSYMNLTETDWHTVCLRVCVFVSWTKTNSKKVEADEIFQRPWDMDGTWFQLLLINPALVGGLVRLCWLYKQPGDWYAPAWSMLPQVKRAVALACCLLFFTACGLLSIAEVSLSCNRKSW